jgi:hypothetical protein
MGREWAALVRVQVQFGGKAEVDPAPPSPMIRPHVMAIWSRHAK